MMQEVVSRFVAIMHTQWTVFMQHVLWSQVITKGMQRVKSLVDDVKWFLIIIHKRMFWYENFTQHLVFIIIITVSVNWYSLPLWQLLVAEFQWGMWASMHPVFLRTTWDNQEYINIIQRKDYHKDIMTLTDLICSSMLQFKAMRAISIHAIFSNKIHLHNVWGCGSGRKRVTRNLWIISKLVNVITAAGVVLIRLVAQPR